ncbi:MAG: InlB B-repeat-containing protein [Paludibacteraceae bacterium]|nr:InlB B-repeat-containing protein [Paludibacteraceae bacterium]
MKNFNLLRKSERKSVGTTLALTVGSPSFDRRGTMLKHYAFMLLFLLGSLNVWGEEMAVDFESATSDYSDWTFTNFTTQQTNTSVTAHGGNYFGTTGGKTTGSLQTKDKVNPSSITFYYSKTTNNTTASYWKVQVSTDGSKWTDVSQKSAAANVDKGQWYAYEENLSAYSDVYVRIYYDGTSAVRCLDDVVLTTSGGGKTLTSIAVSGTPTKTSYYAGDDFDPAGLTVTGTYSDATSGPISSGITWTYNPSQTLVKDQTSIGVIATVSEIASPQYNVTGLSVTAASLKITITQNEVTDFTNTYAEYSWTAAGVSGKMYAFKNSGMQFNSKKTGYYVYNTDPIPGRITKITMIQASGTAQNWTPYVSTTAMTSASGTALDAKSVTTSGASWDVTGSNRYFYLTVAGGSTVIGSIVIEYTEEAPPAVEAPSISGDENFVTSTTVTISHAEADHIYYTTNGDDPTTSSTEYSVPFEVNATTTIKAIAVKGEDVSAVAEMTFTKATILTVAQAKTAIDAGGDLSNKYVAGIVSKIDTYNSTYNSLTYWISDDGTTANQLQVYSGLAGVVKNQFASKDDIHVGDDVTVKGTLKKYSSTYEFDKNNVIVAYKPIALLSWSAASYDAELGESNSFPTLTNTNSVSVTYSSSNTDAATINATTGEISLVAEGSTTIKATFAGNENYKANAVSYSLKVKNAITRADISFEENGGSEVADLTQQTNLPDPLPVITKAGKNFGGWFIDSKMETPAVAGAAVTSTAAITLYAKWLDPYTVAEALDIIDGYGDNETSEANVYVAGIISSVDSYNSTYKSITYYISVDGTTTGQLQVYSGKGLNGADFIGEDDLQKGDNVIVYGELKKYVKNTTVTPEVNQNSQLYYFNRPTVDLVSIALPATASVKVGKTTTLTPVFDPENATDKVVSWASENTSIATVDNGVVTGVSAGTVNITVTYVADPTINATCAVTVSEPLSFNDPNYEWQLVTSDAQLVAGKYYVIASTAKGKVAGAISSDVLGTVNATIVDGAIAYNAFGTDQTADAASAVVFELGGTTGAWTLNEAIDELGQLAYKGNKTVKWETESTAAWAITIADNNATLVPAAANTYHMLYNVSSPRFTIYTSDPAANMLLPQLYVWALKTNKLRYDANGGENAPAAQAADGEGKATVTDAKPTKEDYIFKEWNTLIDGNGEAKAAGDVIDLSAGDVTLYAQWRDPNTYSISYDANGGTLIEGESAITTTSVTEGNAYTIEENVYEVEGKLFIGWKANGVTYNAGQEIYPTENMTFVAQWGDPNVTDFMLVTDVKQLKDGDKVYIVAAEYNVAMGTQNDGNYRNYVEIAKLNNRVVILNATPVEFTVGKVDDNFTFNDGTGFLYASSSDKNYLITKDVLDDNGKWAITIDADGVASIIAKGANENNNLKWNNSSPRFSCYKSGQKAVSIYKRPDYTRNVSGNYATICLPKAGQIIGATLYEIAYYGETSKKIFFDEIVNGEMEAGIPYIFQPAAGVEKINVYYSDNTAEDVGAGNRNGLIGFYDLNDPAATHNITQDAGFYILYNNQYWLVSGRAAYVENYRAYIELNQIDPSEPTLAPGRRRISMSVNDTQTTTGVENGELINGENGVQKVLIDGELFILRGEKMYDAKGQLVK